MSDQKRLGRAIVRVPGNSFAEGLTTVALGIPDYAKAVAQHASYCEALEQCGLTLTRLDADERYPDSTFLEDTAVIIGAPGDARHLRKTAVITRPGAPSRAGEVETIAETLAHFFSEIAAIEEPATLDGGDVCEAGNHFFIGISKRTNDGGARQLTKILTSFGYTSSVVDIRRLENILHLKSGLSFLGDNRLAVINALATHEAFRPYELLRVNSREEYAANCVRVNSRILIAAGYPEFERKLRDFGYPTISLGMMEFQKMDGGLSCLSLRF